MGGCGLFDVGCNAENFVKSAIGDAIENFATAVVEAFGKTVASLGTVWVNIGTPNPKKGRLTMSSVPGCGPQAIETKSFSAMVL